MADVSELVDMRDLRPVRMMLPNLAMSLVMRSGRFVQPGRLALCCLFGWYLRFCRLARLGWGGWLVSADCSHSGVFVYLVSLLGSFGCFDVVDFPI